MTEHSSARNRDISDTFNIRYRHQGQFKESLGRGAEAPVYGAVYRGNAVAIKEFPTPTPESKVEREVAFMEMMRGEYHVAQYIGKFVNPEKKVCIVMELAYNLTLGDLLRRSLVLPRELRIRLAREVCLGVRALHGKGIAHEDIKTDNVLLNFGLRAKLCDFGASKFISEDDYPAKSGTRGKKAPEKERGGRYDRLRSDIFSLGLLLEEVLQGVGSEFSALLSNCTSEEPGERSSCDEILAALPNFTPVAYSRFVNLDQTLSHLDESEKFNISYTWTDCEPDEDSNLAKGREFFFRGLYDDAFDYFYNVDSEELPVADVFLGIMKFHGLGPCEEDVTAARDHFERVCENENLEANGSTKALSHYYRAMTLMTIAPLDIHQRACELLHRLAAQGNAYGPAVFGRMLAQNLWSFHQDFRHRLIAKSLFKAVKAGYSAAEAYLTFFYIYYNASNAMPAIPAMEMEYLKRSVEGGSALGRLLLDFVNQTIDEDELLQTKSPEIFIFVGFLYSLTGRADLARRWLSEAASSSGEGAALMAASFDDEGNSEEALVWLIKAKDYCKIPLSQGPAIAGIQYHAENFRFSPTPSWQLRLAERYLNEGRLNEARSLIAAVASDTRTWYDVMSLRSFALKSESARSMVKEARNSLSDSVAFVLAFVFQQSGLRDEAVEWLEECIRRGHTEALTSLGTIFYEEQNFKKARYFFERGAERGSMIAKSNLGFLEHNYSMNYDRAVFYLDQAASENFPPAMAHLANLLSEIDKSKHLEQAKKLHKQCCSLGYDDRLWGLVALLDCETETAELEYWIDRALRNVDFRVIAELGIAFEDISTPELVDKAAGKGTGQSLYHKGLVLWLNLFGGHDEDPDEAYKYFSIAAEKMGHIDSIGKCYLICEEKGDLDGIEKWKIFMKERGLFALAELLSNTAWE